ncbi:hypothetical protein GobsT_24230 [Gemmata obscuriglobus]|uniref:N-acetyltransferase n=1 Tax=Gemmata obscuriglobus TaxID=114 RepID=A0A2Z3H8F2_9BACT|nr:hypothetical protein [Gemmata obscuriglobus]AWM39275.1 N-acetyltransferase [Gemmata obscuriglobus]QEG27664.1 hypothetical protein GobsT_24230 [Gemmata obscuriglobus]VTS04851.1 Uncharacterized protein OS=Mycobacterium liflandii (strain 128FXT) GN=MULP_04658 PE=4 SV=1 [Gemmata obscuriglobus UQM 2246]
MNVHHLTAAPGADLAAALARFEEQFTYPLGAGRSFRISHGDDYPRFFRAIGDAACFVAERAGEVLGVIGLARTRVRGPGGAERPAIYVGDLKLAPAARGGRALPRLAEAAAACCAGKAERGFGVVMDGTPVTPDRYTGRLGVPPFREVARVTVLRIPAHTAPGAAWETDEASGRGLFAELSSGHTGTAGGVPEARSQTDPTWLAAPDGSAVGRLEDTRLAKRLIATDGEMIAAHLSCTGYANHRSLAALLRTACGAAARRGFPALFTAVPADEADPVLAVLDEPGTVVAPATVFASGFETGCRWQINTAEI